MKNSNIQGPIEDLLYFTLIISQQKKKKKYIQIHVHKKKSKMPREGQKQEQATLRQSIQTHNLEKIYR